MKKTRPIKIVVGLLVILVLGLVQFQYDLVWILFRPRLKPEPLAPLYLQSIAFSIDIQQFSSENIDQLKELESFRLSESVSPIIAISEDGGQQWIMAINGEGEFVHWEMESRQIVRKFDFNAAYPSNTNFSEDGSRLLASGETVWDTRLGEIIYCRPSKCGRHAIEDNEIPRLLDPAGKITIRSYSDTIDFDLLESGVIHFLVRDCNSRYVNEVTDENVHLFTIDPSATYSAYIFLNGVVCVKSFNEFIGYDLKTGNDLPGTKIDENGDSSWPSAGTLRFKLPGNHIESKFAAFDPTRNWLAVITENELVVWDLHNLFFPLQLNRPIKGGTTLAFDRSGKILVLGTTSGIQMFDVEQSKLLAEIEMDGVTALFFSRDNRLLIAGDSQGIVHVFGIPK